MGGGRQWKVQVGCNGNSVQKVDGLPLDTFLVHCPSIFVAVDAQPAGQVVVAACV